MPGLSGVGDPQHVALTVDDGPDPITTPAYLSLFAQLGVHATFFVLGTRLRRWPDLGRRIVAEGHDLGVHGWVHRPHLLLPAPAVAADLLRAVRLMRQQTHAEPRFWRPPHGIPTTTGLVTAARLGLRPALWTADGRDWRANATPDSVAAKIRAQLRGGGVVLLHDAQQPDGRSRAALGAVRPIVEWARQQEWTVGSLADHSTIVAVANNCVTSL
jgi:peptidoglycan/xylan/chitin deacetylase (PgdA/CDA1 family)